MKAKEGEAAKGGPPPFVMPEECRGVTAKHRKAVPAGAVIVSIGKTAVTYVSKTGGYHKAQLEGVEDAQGEPGTTGVQP